MMTKIELRPLRAALMLCAAIPGAVQPAAADTASPSEPAAAADAALDALMLEVFRATVKEQPQSMTLLGLDSGKNSWARSALDDLSAEARAASRLRSAALLARLNAVDRSALSPRQRRNYDAVIFQLRVAGEGEQRFDYGAAAYPAPYSVSQLDGAYRDIPDLLSEQHPLETEADAEAYLARLGAFATSLDQQSAQVRREAAEGAAPPDFILARTLEQLSALRTADPAASILVTAFAKRLAAANLDAAHVGRAVEIVQTSVTPALDRQIALIRSLQPAATHDAGVWRLPDGDAYYDFALRYFTTTDLSAEEIHRIGLRQVAEISSEIDRILQSQGMTEGSVGARLARLQRQPDQIYPNDAAGRAQLLDDLNQHAAAMRTQLPPYFGVLAKAPLEIRRVPEAIEAGAPGGYYYPPALDGSRGGIYYINLRDTAEWPRWRLPTLSVHEGVPGHHWQLSIAAETPKMPPLRQIMSYSAYSEGWGLYAEQLADEMGAYRDDPLGRVGYLQSQLFRAARLVVDTGIHRMRWSREKAIRYFMDTLGEAESKATTEVERYVVHPGQATSYKVGHNLLVELRSKAERALGERFDLKAFHDTILLAGAMPLAALETVVDEWIADCLKGKSA